MEFTVQYALTQEDQLEFRSKWKRIRQGLLLSFAQRVCSCITPEKLKRLDPELSAALHDMALVCDCAHLPWWSEESIQTAVAKPENRYGI